MNSFGSDTHMIAALACASCALVGTFLVLRRMSLLGDAISHAVLPGLVIGFMISGSRSLWPMAIGAVAAGLLTTFLTEALARRGDLENSAGMGVVFTSLFALGVLLINQFHDSVDLDPNCLLYGDLGTVALDTLQLGGRFFPRALIPLGLVLSLNLVLVTGLWKELKVTSFDPALATTLGISAGLMHYLLMSSVAVTTVACFESVGSILVIAMLIVPAATAHLLTDRLFPMVLYALVASQLAAWGGCALARQLNVSEAGMIATTAGAIFVMVVLAAPRHGILSSALRRRMLSLRILEEDILARLYRAHEKGNGQIRNGWEEAGITAPARSRWIAIRTLAWKHMISVSERGYRLTPQGEVEGRALVRSHRAWESYLSTHVGLPLDHLHEPAHRMEHFLDEQLAEAIMERLDRPHQDPHGRDIPE